MPDLPFGFREADVEFRLAIATCHEIVGEH